MINRDAESILFRLIAFGTPFVTLFIVTGSVTDPVNLTKLLAIGGVSVAVFLVSISFGIRDLVRNSRGLLIFIILFITFSLLSTIASEAPLSQNLYGVYGRNTGFLAYLFLGFMMLGASLIRNLSNFKKIVYGLFVAGFVNLIYCFIAWKFKDPIGWNNPYKTILGTFGNPDFISAFLGIFAVSLIAYAIGKETSWKFRGITAASVVLALLEIKQSHAIQGFAVFASGIAIIGLYLIRSLTEKKSFQLLYIGSVSSVGFISLMGTLQKGPLAELVYKTSVSLRGEYWAAGIRMGMDHPLTGVGMDTYGDWYRRTRDAQALILPGPKVVTNTAHNVIIDFFAYGGWPLLVSYLGLLIVGSISIIKVMVRNSKYDGVFVAFSVSWACYQIQSVISINQIGLAIWGWMLTGLLVAYEVSTRDIAEEKDSENHKSKRKKSHRAIFSPSLLAGLGAVIGVFLAAPPLSADSAWRAALQSGSIADVEKSLSNSYFHPLNSARLTNATEVLRNSNLPEFTHKYALKGTEFNKNYFDAWVIMYYSPLATEAEKKKAISEMKRLDPLNTKLVGALTDVGP
jgi:O-antigen ligase